MVGEDVDRAVGDEHDGKGAEQAGDLIDDSFDIRVEIKGREADEHSDGDREEEYGAVEAPALPVPEAPVLVVAIACADVEADGGEDHQLHGGSDQDKNGESDVLLNLDAEELVFEPVGGEHGKGRHFSVSWR